MRRATLFLDLLLVFLFTAVLVAPLFKAKYLDRWDSIESTFIADGRFLAENAPHPLWQPLWYCGTRYDYLYPPVMRYGTALLSRVYLPVKAYHIYTGLLYCLGSAGIYLLVWVTNRSRAAAWLAAVAWASVTPVLLLIPWRSPHLAPWRLNTLLGNGEGPHVASISLLPFALAFAWRALERHRPASLVAAAFCCALVALTNFYGAMALAVFYAVLVWSLWVAHGSGGRFWLRAVAIPGLAYGLAAFWLTPSYLRLTVDNLHYVSSQGNAWSRLLLVVTVAAFAVISERKAKGQPERAYAVFLCGSLLAFGLNVAGYFHFHFRIVGEPHRWASELDFVMILCLVDILRRLWQWRTPDTTRLWTARGIAGLILLWGVWASAHYFSHAWELYPREADYRQRVEYRLQDWMASHIPQARTLVAGSIRFWWDTWHDLAQVTGGSDQGLMNPHVVQANWEIMLGSNPALAVRWLTALGADAVIVNDQQSQEKYHDFKVPGKFAGALPVLFDDKQGDIIYQVPRRYASLARVVDRARFDALQPLEQSDLFLLQAYTAAIEEGPDAPTATSWRGTDAMRIHAHVAQGQSILVQVTYDPAWHAYAGPRELPVRQDRAADFSVIDAPPGDYDIAFVFETPWENRIAWVVTWLSLALAAGLMTASKRTQRT